MLLQLRFFWSKLQHQQQYSYVAAAAAAAAAAFDFRKPRVDMFNTVVLLNGRLHFIAARIAFPERCIGKEGLIENSLIDERLQSRGAI